MSEHNVSELYFSKRLSDKMKHMRTAGFTIVEAPAGYGKTTLISEALKNLPDVYWYIGIQPVSKGSWQWFLDRLEMLDAHVAGQLRSLDTITAENADKAAGILMEMNVEQDTYIVFDNFQYIAEEWEPQVLAVFARRKPDGLHIICAAQYMGVFHRTPQGKNKSLCVVLEDDLLLSKEEIQGLARKKRIELAPADVSAVYAKTDGWAVAVELYLHNRKKYGERLLALTDTNELLYDMFWKKLKNDEKELLLRLAPFERLELKYVDEILPAKLSDREEVQAIFSKVPLLEYQESRQTYVPHELLCSFLRFQLSIADKSFRHEVCMQAGNVYLKWGWTVKAVECYYKIKDYEKILSCNLSGLLMEKFDGDSYQNMARNILEHCPKKIQKKYPVSILKLCYGLFAGAAFEDFEKYMMQTRMFLEEDRETDSHTLGEWLMVSALSQFPDVDKMKQVYREAETYMSRPSEVFNSEEPFMFGCTTMFYLFYHKSGKMMDTADKLEEMLQVYNRLTADHGAGAAELYRAEAVEVQGDFEKSDILAHKAQLMAEKTGNVSVIYGVAQLRGINALYQSDMAAAEKAVQYLDGQAEKFAQTGKTNLKKMMEETVRSYVLAIMMETGHSADWTLGEADSLSDLTFTNFIVKLSRTTDLILKKEYQYAIAGIEASLNLDRRLLSVPALNMMYVGLVMCYLAIGRMIDARQYFEKMLEVAKQDKNYVFIACYRQYFKIFMHVPELVTRYASVMKEIEQIDIQYAGSDKIRVAEMLGRGKTTTETLTRREKEIARLAAKGYRNSEIAQALHITENTVKGYMKIIFRKLEIDRRSYLKEALERHAL